MRWDDVLETMVAEAEAELLEYGEARGWVVAYAGEVHLASVGLRGFDRGEAGEVILEVAALAAVLRADRIAFVASGRAWSLQDPIPPVTRGGDLRQVVIVAEVAERTPAGVVRTSRGWPIDLFDGVAHRRDPICEQTTGPLGELLEVAIAEEVQDELDGADACEQIGLLRGRGHLVHLGATVSWRLGLAGRATWEECIDLAG